MQRAERSKRSWPSSSTSPDARKNSPIAKAAWPGSSAREDSPGVGVTVPSGFKCFRLLLLGPCQVQALVREILHEVTGARKWK